MSSGQKHSIQICPLRKARKESARDREERHNAKREGKLKGKREKKGKKSPSKSCNVLGGLIRAKIKCHTELCSSIDGLYSKSHHPVNSL